MFRSRLGAALVLFVACVVGMLILENIIGVGAAKAMRVDPLIGLIARSVTMAGGASEACA